MIRRVTLEFDTWQEAEGVCDGLSDVGYEPSLQCDNPPAAYADEDSRTVSCGILGIKGLLELAEAMRGLM